MKPHPKYFVALFSLSLAPMSLTSSFAQQLPPPATSAPAPRLKPRANATPRPAPVVEPAYQILPAPALDNAPADSQTQPEAPAPADDNPVIIVPPTVPSVPIPPIRVPQKTTPSAKAKTYSLRVGGVDITKLTDVAAVVKLRAAHDAKLEQKIIFSDGADEYARSLKSLGVSFSCWTLVGYARQAAARKQNIDVPLRYQLDEAKATSALRALAREVDRKPQAIRISSDAAGRAVLRGGDGVEVAVAGSLARLKQALEMAAVSDHALRVELVARRIPAGRKGEGQSTLEQFRYVLAEFATPYDASLRGRTNNLRMAARLVDGTIVPAGGEFSANRAIGPRNAAAGWREAKMFVSGAVVSGVGAGICQCSTTIYNAALLAGLPIVERHPHSMRVTYAPASRDAAIYWGQKDMRFRNNTGGPIYVQTWLERGKFYARIYGTQPRRERVRVESRVVSRRGGTRSEAYRVRETSAGAVRERLSRDHYKPRPDLQTQPQ